jgi:hypothetical protein
MKFTGKIKSSGKWFAYMDSEKLDSEKRLTGLMKEDIKKVYAGNKSYQDTDLDELSEVNGPYGIVDPRRLGFSYPSYMLIKSGSNIESGFDFNGFPEDEYKSLMMSSTLGDFDFINRRCDVNNYKHAEYVVEAIDRDELEFMQNVETYPIFSIGRWHGQDVSKGDMTLQRSPSEVQRDKFSKLQSELIYEYIHNPEGNSEELLDDVRRRVEKNSEKSLIEDTEEIEKELKKEEDIKSLVGSIKEKCVLQEGKGKSIGIDVPSISGFHHVLIGISVEEGINIEDGKFELPNEKVMHSLKQEYDGWEMPYIVSGVGKSWGDIIVEMHIESIEEMNDIAMKMREDDEGIRGINSTKTFTFTKTKFNEPFTVPFAEEIEAIKDCD